jgi:N utilization substance protein B
MMISRRLIRIKIVQVLYAFCTDENSTLEKSEKELQQSIKKAYDLYHYFILLIINVADYAADRIDQKKNKILPTDEDLNPNIRFINNSLITKLKNCDSLFNYVRTNHLSWQNHPEIIKKLYQKIVDSENFLKYMEMPNVNYDDDKKIIIDIYYNELEDWESLYQLLEEDNIYWNDDIEFVISMIIKTLQQLKASNNKPVLMKLYKNEDDKEFAINLLRKTILKHAEYREIIDKYTKNWEIDRIAVMDVIIMEVAMAELLEFPSIPVKVTLNEYIDISRLYSTHKSNEFVNGILDKIVIDLRKENKISKTGRGLNGETIRNE